MLRLCQRRKVIQELQLFIDVSLSNSANECAYVKLATRPNPISEISATVSQYVWNLYQNPKINQKCYYYLHCSNAVSPMLYGLPKIHKSAVPLRPFVNSPAYNLSKFLSRIVSNLVKIVIAFVILGNSWSMLKTVMFRKMKFLYLLMLLVCLLLCQWTRPLTSCWNSSHLMMLCLLAHLSAFPISNKV